jgi:hypothetical protein
VLQSAADNVARFDHNPVTGESLGLLIEEQRTNSFERSEEFDNAYWTKANSSITANTIIAPDGTLTGDKLVEDTTTGEHTMLRSLNYTSGVAYTLSCYVKAGGQNFVVLQFSSAFSGAGLVTRAWFNLSNGTVGTLANSPTASIVPVGNGWYRCSITKTAGATGASNTVITACNADNSVSYTGDGFSGIYIWGAQLEAGAFPTSYIPTTTAQVTRSADAASMTGANFSSWFRQDEGSMFVEMASPDSTGARAVVVNNGTANDSYLFGWVAGASELRSRLFSGGALQYQFAFTGVTITNFNKLATSYKTNDCAASLNGASALTDTSAVLPVVNQMTLHIDGSSDPVTATIRKIAYYPKRLADAEIVALTT